MTNFCLECPYNCYHNNISKVIAHVFGGAYTYESHDLFLEEDQPPHLYHDISGPGRSPETQHFLSGFLEYLAAREKHAGGAEGFLSESTATGLRVPISSTSEFLLYLANLGYRYLMTSRLI